MMTARRRALPSTLDPPPSTQSSRRLVDSCSKGQSALEYATLLAVLVAALVGMQVYVKRGIAGKVRLASDSVSEPYDPRNTEGGFVIRSSNTTQTTELTCNEPQLSGQELCFGEGICFDVNKDNVCDCIDLNNKNGCTDRDAFGTVRRSDLLGEITNRTGQETVGPLGDTLWE